MPESTAPFKNCVGCMHLGSKRIVEGGGQRPICKLRVREKFTADCAFSPIAHQTRVDELYRMPAAMRTRIGCEG